MRHIDAFCHFFPAGIFRLMSETTAEAACAAGLAARLYALSTGKIVDFTDLTANPTECSQTRLTSGRSRIKIE